MAPFLSPAWIDEVDEAARADEGLRAVTSGARVTVQQVVTGGPGGEVRYWVEVDDGSVRVGAGSAERADATVTQSYETAVALRAGALAVEDALLTGRVRLGGDIGLLVRHQAALLGVATALGTRPDRAQQP